MLVPNRFSNLKTSLTNITALSIDYLLKQYNNSAKVGDLLKHLKKTSQEIDRKDVVQITLFLYAIGKVEYNLEDDSIKLVQQC